MIHMSSTANNRRIAKNTALLYVRMLVMMGVTLFTSRVVLQALGVEDFGIYNIVGGVVVLFSFVNNAMLLSTQRFLNYELGRGDAAEAGKVFSASLTIHLAIAAAFLLLAETVGLWFLYTYINLPAGRWEAALWVYQLSVLATVISVARAPYNAAIIAYERMSFFAYVSVVEGLLKLGIVYMVYLFADRLVAYAALMAAVVLAVTLFYRLFCLRHFPICRYRYEYDRRRYRAIAGFSGWSVFGSAANVGASQGLNVILNMFFGVAVNAAMGIANQVNAAVYQFVGNFQTAFNPQIVKLYAAGESGSFINLILNTSRYSFLLLFVIALPVYVCCPELLRLWLGTVPEYAVPFCRLMLAFSLIDAWQGPLWVSAQATGKIRNYQLLMSFMILLNLPVTYLLLVFFRHPELALAVRVAVNAATALVRVIYLHRLYRFPIRRYLREVVAVSLAVAALSLPLPLLVSGRAAGIPGLSLSVAMSLACALAATALVGVTGNERQMVFRKIRQCFLHR